MKQILLLMLSLIIAFPAAAQFADGYGPSHNEEEDNAAEEPASSVLFNSPREATSRPAPQPQEMPRIKKPTPYTGSIRILAVVNGEIITTEDINHRVRAFCLNSGIPYNDESKWLILNHVMQNTIDEKLKLQDAVKNNIVITDKEIDNAIKSFEAKSNIPAGGHKKLLKEYAVSEDVFREQMKSDLAWLQLVRQRSAAENITKSEIDEAIALAEKDADKIKFKVSEIVIPTRGAKNIDRFVRDLRNDRSFELYAAKFSHSPSSGIGGNIGWVNAGQMPKPLDSVLQKMRPGEISDPVVYDENYYIFYLDKKFDPAAEKMSIPSDAEAKYLLQNQKMERYAAQHLQELRQRAAIEMKE